MECCNSLSINTLQAQTNKTKQNRRKKGQSTSDFLFWVVGFLVLLIFSPVLMYFTEFSRKREKIINQNKSMDNKCKKKGFSLD